MRFDLRLYALLDPAVAGGRRLTDVAKLIADQATLVQLRDKHGSTRVLIDEARALHDVLKPKAVPLLINDRVDVALAAKADGVHIGQSDMSAADARALLGRDAIIGLSINTVALAEEAPLDLLDYVGIGGIYATTSKDNTKPPIGIAGLRAIVRVVQARKPGFPVCGIAGISHTNAGDVIEAGADGVAVISALSLAPAPEEAARNLRSIVDTALSKRGAA